MVATLALIAHDAKKDEIVSFAQQHKPILSRYRLIATGNTGQRIEQATGLTVERMASGPLGGDTQIAAEVVSGHVVLVVFLMDPLYAQPHEPDIQALLRVCNVNDVPLATNLATAEILVSMLGKKSIADLIFNPMSGQGNADQELSIIRQFLDPHFHLRVHEMQDGMDIVEVTKEAIANDSSLVIASGGDGTVSAVAGALINTDIPLGIIPRGTANAFAAALGMPRLAPIRNACQTILNGHVRTVDVARCNGVPMILLAGIGFEAETVELANTSLKDQWGALAYLVAGWQTIDKQQSFETRIEAGGEVYTFEAGSITIANAAPATSVLAQGGGHVAHDDGKLDITIASAETRLQGVSTMLRMFGAAIVGTGVEQQNVVHMQTDRLTVITEPPQKVVLDGEMIGTTPVEVVCIPGGLKVLAPPAVTDNQGNS
ncbi:MULTISPECIES: methylglyoxal synthase [unclassified Leptolyngbya]|uniref:methylglyoxal synthase n=1 Tax=unclassified Leptolyngbya TaxID=2650499 RepID=UPI001689D9F0|nr:MULTISPECIES: methylglyoxal synthase [unclassified Leptolyngbya]MBD1910920.1 methylglyoxal synthase [Leptolyngbya sp. FACHB-8]MBD2154965.1 methylglyoxal synthase [Leptolyngbya sp. FACHB-16]